MAMYVNDLFSRFVKNVLYQNNLKNRLELFVRTGFCAVCGIYLSDPID